ncbi:MAG: ATP-dependent nuclease [Vicinamibacteria bacterium]
MRISRIHIENFRNFAHLDVRLSSNAVIVGENKIGKSNLLHALRLILDPSLPDSARQLRDEDFWDGLPRPLTTKDRILVSIELTDFEDREDQTAILADHLVQPEPMVARLTYVYQPKAEAGEGPFREADYEFFIFGGARPENRIGYDVRRRIPLDVLPALRDAEGDLANWRRSPLRPLLDKAASGIDRDKLQEIVGDIAEATNAVTETDEIKALGERISKKIKEIVGGGHAIETLFGFSPTDPERLIRSLRLFIDGGKRSISEASLGSANVLYLTLKELELEELVADGSRSHTFLAIEEPEAHLHPHLQRLVYREFLRLRRHQEGGGETGKEHAEARTVILTTHSPHIASVSPLRSLVLLRKSNDLTSTEGVSAAGVSLDDAEERDLERYLDVTRGEILFAKGVILVEGDAELFLVPIVARLRGMDLDELGISVCSVSGTNFAPYVKLLRKDGLCVPFAVITDRDPDGSIPSPGERRVLRLLAEIAGAKALEGKSLDKRLELGRKQGLFIAEHCLEVDLFRCGRYKSMTKVLAELAESEAARKRANGWARTPDTLAAEELLKDITAIGKGRFAQRLATRIRGTACPSYITEALEYVAQRCR